MRKLQIFFKEKDLPHVQWELKDHEGNWHLISNDVVIEAILNASKKEQQQIYKKIVRLDFVNADINDFLKHLAGGLIN